MSGWLRKLGAILLVLVGVTAGMIGLGLVVDGNWQAAPLLLVMPGAILLALRLTPEGGTTGYFDRNI